MKKTRRAAAVILAAATAVLMANTAVMAETKAAGPEISIETDRTEYSSTDPINETVKIYNASDDILTDIVISGSIPEGYQTEDGVASPDQWEMKTGDGESGGTGSRDGGRENRRGYKNDTDRRRGSYFEGGDYIPDRTESGGADNRSLI